MASKKEFIKQLAIYLVADQAHKSIMLSAGNRETQEWAALRGKTPLFGYPTVEEAERELTKFLDGPTHEISMVTDDRNSEE